MLVYDFEVFKEDWLVVFKSIEEGWVDVVHNNIEELKDILNKHKILIGFNNYNYDDVILYALIVLNYNNRELYELSQSIVKGEIIPFKYDTNKIVSLDCMQELQMGVSLKKCEANMGTSIKETNVPFDIPRKLTPQELNEVYEYCKHDVLNTEKVYKLREDYFKAKLDIVNEFNLTPIMFKKTRAFLSGIVLEANKNNLPKTAIKDRLFLTYVPQIKWSNIPKELQEFYNNIILDFSKGMDYKELEKRNLTLTINGVDISFGFGGQHGARRAYKFKGKIFYFDVSSYYSSMMIKYKFLSRACKNPKDFENLYNTRFKLKSEENHMEYIYKILLNATYGATKDQYSAMFDPVQANNICVNGQIILTDLIIRLEPYTELIQSNTDGIMVACPNPNNEDKIFEIVKEWEENYGLKLGLKTPTAIYQRDVNNYLLVLDNDKFSGKGRIKNWNINKNNFESYDLAIIDIAFKNYYVDNISIEDTITNLINDKNFMPFQIVAKHSSKYESLAQYDINSNTFIKLDQKVNRVFATKFKNKGMLYKVKNGKYEKYPNTPEYTYIHNEDINTLSPEIIDKDWYIDLCNKFLIENQIIKKKSSDLGQVSLFDIF